MKRITHLKYNQGYQNREFNVVCPTVSQLTTSYFDILETGPHHGEDSIIPTPGPYKQNRITANNNLAGT